MRRALTGWIVVAVGFVGLGLGAFIGAQTAQVRELPPGYDRGVAAVRQRRRAGRPHPLARHDAASHRNGHRAAGPRPVGHRAPAAGRGRRGAARRLSARGPDPLPGEAREPTGRVRVAELATIGYESATVQTFLEALSSHGIDLLIDIRAVASSRRPGFAKSALTANLASAGIEYLHLRDLGTPAEGRAAARAGRHAEMRRIFEVHLATARSAGRARHRHGDRAIRAPGVSALPRGRSHSLPSKPGRPGARGADASARDQSQARTSFGPDRTDVASSNSPRDRRSYCSEAR